MREAAVFCVALNAMPLGVNMTHHQPWWAWINFAALAGSSYMAVTFK